MPREEVASVRRGSYRVIFDRDESGAWIARVVGLRGSHTHGRTLEQARRRIREALALWAEDADTAELAEEILLPAPARAAIRESKDARYTADRQRRSAQVATAEAARLLVEELDLGLRDAGELLDLSYQRVQQLVSSTERPRNS
jgi:predicted RNase H-like HicB family nuclease